MKIVNVVGTRPQFIKYHPVSRALEQIVAVNSVRDVLVHTGQHYDYNMSRIFLMSKEVIFPMHPRMAKVYENTLTRFTDSVKIIKPLGYFDLILLLKNASLLFTDQNHDIKAVAIASPAAAHYEFAKRALMAGKDSLYLFQQAKYRKTKNGGKYPLELCAS